MRTKPSPDLELQSKATWDDDNPAGRMVVVVSGVEGAGVEADELANEDDREVEGGDKPPSSIFTTAFFLFLFGRY